MEEKIARINEINSSAKESIDAYESKPAEKKGFWGAVGNFLNKFLVYAANDIKKRCL